MPIIILPSTIREEQVYKNVIFRAFGQNYLKTKKMQIMLLIFRKRQFVLSELLPGYQVILVFLVVEKSSFWLKY